MPLTPLQYKIMRAISANRSPESYVAGGSALNSRGGRFSNDIDIFADDVEAVSASAQADEASLLEAKFSVDWKVRQGGFMRALVSDRNNTTRLEWASDSAFRFFPTQKDDDFGYVLHPVDLATNKILAASDRREVRDAVDLQRVEDEILPLGPVAWAAAKKSPGRSPEMIVGELRRQARFQQEELDQERLGAPLAAAHLNTWLKSACDRAEGWIKSIPPQFEFGLFVDRSGRPGTPDFSKDSPGDWSIHEGRRGGVWPTSPGISSSMLNVDWRPKRAPEGHSRDD